MIIIFNFFTASTCTRVTRRLQATKSNRCLLTHRRVHGSCSKCRQRKTVHQQRMASTQKFCFLFGCNGGLSFLCFRFAALELFHQCCNSFWGHTHRTISKATGSDFFDAFFAIRRTLGAVMTPTFEFWNVGIRHALILSRPAIHFFFSASDSLDFFFQFRLRLSAHCLFNFTCFAFEMFGILVNCFLIPRA